MSSIDKLPEELLVEIFKHYVWNDTPQRLLRVSKRWYAVTTSASALWANILLCPPPFPPSYSYISDSIYCAKLGDVPALRNKVICESVASLVEAIKRTKGSKIDLTIILPDYYTLSEKEADILDPPSFSNRCRALNFIHRASHQLSKNFKDLSALEELRIIGDANPDHSPMHSLDSTPGHSPMHSLDSTPDHSPMNSLIQAAIKTAFRLHFLELITYKGLPILKDLSELLPRITTIHLKAYRPQDFVGTLKTVTSVKTLTFELLSPGLNREESASLDCPSPSLHTLNLIHVQFWSVSNDTLRTITHLYIRWSRYWPIQYNQSMELSNLTHLTLVDCWSAISLIRAPHLHTLKLHSKDGWSDGTLERLGATDLRPITLDLDTNVPDNKLKSLIGRIWNDVEDLQICLIGDNRTLMHRLASSFMPKARKKRLCPKLRRLVIMSKKRLSSWRIKAEGLLREIANERKGDGVLKVVRYGWYMEEKNIDNPRDGKVDWVEIL